jgi:ABC-2 type transport system permease protein
VNWAHFKAFVWLRWRLMANQWRRAGSLNAVLTMIVVVSAIIMAIPLFFGAFALAVFLIPKAAPAHLMYVWDGLIFFFLMFWAIGLLVELQRNDPLSLSKFLHLPVSVTGAFLINYFSSLLRLSLVIFGPVMLAFALALIYIKGLGQLAVLPALAAFFLMITAPTYQFQGWLGSLMSNPRRRRSIVVGMTMGIVLLFQLPNAFNFYFTPKFKQRQNERIVARGLEDAKLQQAALAKEIDAQEHAKRQKELRERYAAQEEQENRELATNSQRIAWIINAVVPLGWLPVGVMSSAEGNVLPALLGVAGMTLIGAISLWLAYRSTLAQFQGQSSNRKVRPASPAPVRHEEGDRRPGGRLLEARLPGLSEPVSAIALGGFRSLLRSPEAKMTLIAPLIMGIVFGSILIQGRQTMPDLVRPLFGIGAISFVLFGLLQLMGNQFGTDRDGFRVFVLCAAPRRDILLGKNLSFVPVAVIISAILVGAVLVICPMRIDHALSMIPQFVSMFLLFCPMANLFSIFAPVFINAGTLKAAHPKMSTILLQLLMFMILFPLCQGLTLIPLGIEAALHAYGVAEGLPVSLLLSLIECAAILVFYYYSLGWLGSCLQAREQKILETVTNRGS